MVERETQRQEEKLRDGEKWSWGEEGRKLERQSRGNREAAAVPTSNSPLAGLQKLQIDLMSLGIQAGVFESLRDRSGWRERTCDAVQKAPGRSLAYLILTETLYYYHLRFTGPERLRNLPKVTEPVRGGRAGI